MVVLLFGNVDSEGGGACRDSVEEKKGLPSKHDNPN